MATFTLICRYSCHLHSAAPMGLLTFRRGNAFALIENLKIVLLFLSFMWIWIIMFCVSSSPRCGQNTVCWCQRLHSEEEARTCSLHSLHPQNLPSCYNDAVWVVFAFCPAPYSRPWFTKLSHILILTIQTSSYNGSPVSGWRRDLDTGPRRQTVAIWIVFCRSPVLLFWSYPVFGPGMDVPEASKHGKKSTCQKLEDQKNVGKSLLLFVIPLGALQFSSSVLLFRFYICWVCCSLPKKRSASVW